MADATGKIVQVTGGVVDVDFSGSPLPNIYYALEINLEGEEYPMVLEVQNHLGNGWVRTVAMDVPPQDVITKDNVSVKVNAVLYFRVVEPEKALIEVEDYLYATSQLAQTSLRSVLGQAELDELLSHRDRINQQLQEILDRQTDPWGVKVSNVEIKHVDLPQEMQRAMAKQAEAERDRRLHDPEKDGRRPARAQPGRLVHRARAQRQPDVIDKGRGRGIERTRQRRHRGGKHGREREPEQAQLLRRALRWRADYARARLDVARAELAVRGEPDAGAVATERLRHRGDHAHEPLGVIDRWRIGLRGLDGYALHDHWGDFGRSAVFCCR